MPETWPVGRYLRSFRGVIKIDSWRLDCSGTGGSSRKGGSQRRGNSGSNDGGERWWLRWNKRTCDRASGGSGCVQERGSFRRCNTNDADTSVTIARLTYDRHCHTRIFQRILMERSFLLLSFFVLFFGHCSPFFILHLRFERAYALWLIHALTCHVDDFVLLAARARSLNRIRLPL